MKQLETRTVSVGDNTFHVRPFPAFKAANISGQLATMVTPILGGVLPLVEGIGGKKGVLDLSLEEAAPAITGAFSSLSGDELEALLKELLTKNKNISVDDPDTGKPTLLTEDVANELFCADTQDMFMLAVEVIKLNFNGFFKKLVGQFGSAFDALKTKMPPSIASMVG